MKIPKGKTESEVLEIIDNVVNRIAFKFKFPGIDLSDLKQEGRYEALKALSRYNPNLPLENFLYVHVHNRLHNFKRDNYARHDPPCISCPFYDPKYKKSENQCEAFVNKNDCDKWACWMVRNADKKNLMQPLDITNIDDEDEDNMRVDFDIPGGLDRKELFTKIDKELDVNMRSDWLKLKSGSALPKNKRVKLLNRVREILGVDLET